MLATRTLIGMIVGGLIIGLGGYSLVDTLGASTVSMNENFVIGSGDNASFSIPAPKDAPQYMKIVGDAFENYSAIGDRVSACTGFRLTTTLECLAKNRLR